ncbi:MAG: 50S ribosomal protein L20 [Chloroflexota bacterium]|nr:50S ribosomal protein L20 [Chloroflexota bacterium]
MPRATNAPQSRERHRKVLKQVKGHRATRSKLFGKANESMMRALRYAYRDRRARKRDFRKLWITRINAAARLNGTTYRTMIHGLTVAGIEVDRKVLAELAVSDPAAFAGLAEQAKQASGAQVAQ